MLDFMQNYEIFTKITVFQESRSKEARRARKGAKMTKHETINVATP